MSTIFKRLLDHFGPQGWWPAETPFEVMVGAILTQNTSWKNVERAIENLKNAGCLTPERITSCPLNELRELIKPAGFYNQKALYLKELSRFLLDHPLEELATLPTHELRRLLLSIKGIGKETADSILLYVFNRPVFVADRYSHRVFSRLGIWRGPYRYEEIRSLVEEEMKDPEELKEFHALVVELAKNYCRPQPRCDACPLKDLCSFNREGE
ncbi:MAG: endonuclease III domain-containing protein [Candidatus Diapherotrites archaeon]|nr:endonuclease III domain-containing protein [Candidatus Diapherotrites archaeon]